MSLRVLFTTTSGLGHIHPTVPLARAMVDRGHDVRWAVPPEGFGAVERTGVRAVVVGSEGLTRPAEILARYPELATLPPHRVPEVLFGKVFGAVAAPALLADLLPLAREWRPDLVVSDAAELAGPIVAADLGVPGVAKAFGPLLPEGRMAAAAVDVAPLWEACGLEPRTLCGVYDHLYLDIYPPGLQPADAAHVPVRRLLRPVLYDGGPGVGGGPPLPEGRPGAPLVYVTMGTVFNGPELLDDVVAALAGLDARVLVTVGPAGDPSAVRSPGSHVRVERYVPQTRLLPHCAVVVSHGGSGTMLAALTHGLPQLCLPQGADQFLNADAIAASGAGLSLGPDAATAPTIATAVARLLTDASFTAAASDLATTIATMPSPTEVATHLESLP